jgi:hypothetical protein
MPSKRQRLVNSIEYLLESSSFLREQLKHYERTMATIARRLEQGSAAIAASEGSDIPTQRRQVTEAIEGFEAARHQLRLALFTLGIEEGASISEIGRTLGISRQLASRLAAQAASQG